MHLTSKASDSHSIVDDFDVAYEARRGSLQSTLAPFMTCQSFHPLFLRCVIDWLIIEDALDDVPCVNWKSSAYSSYSSALYDLLEYSCINLSPADPDLPLRLSSLSRGAELTFPQVSNPAATPGWCHSVQRIALKSISRSSGGHRIPQTSLRKPGEEHGFGHWSIPLFPCPFPSHQHGVSCVAA